jgi:hypothetical protein
MTQADPGQIVESVKFLLKSVRQLSDRFRETNDKLGRSFEAVDADVADLASRIERIEADLRSAAASGGTLVVPLAAPTAPAGEAREPAVVPALNLPLPQLIDTYLSTPILLEPFCRPCSLSGRTLSGETDQVELEAFTQGTTWAVEVQGGTWLLLPRPGSLERRTQVQSLERLFEIEGATAFPATLHLHQPATALAVQHGRRWTLQDRGKLSVIPDPLRRDTAHLLADLDARLARLEGKGAQPG